MAILQDIERFWDDDAATYDRSAHHRPTNPAVRAAWAAALERALPPPPCRVLDCGAGTGFLSLTAARLGHEVTAIDLSAAMLGKLSEAAAREGLAVETVHGPADDPPAGFDAVIERHLLWTLPDPTRALVAWRRAAPSGRLAVFESVWGSADPVERVRGVARHTLRRWRGAAPDHHGSYSPTVLERLPMGSGTPPDRLVEVIAQSGWPHPRMQRLRDVEWAERSSLPLVERLVGVPPRLLVTSRLGRIEVT